MRCFFTIAILWLSLVLSAYGLSVETPITTTNLDQYRYHVAPHDLPADFAKIPPGSPQAVVLASVLLGALNHSTGRSDLGRHKLWVG